MKHINLKITPRNEDVGVKPSTGFIDPFEEIHFFAKEELERTTRDNKEVDWSVIQETIKGIQREISAQSKRDLKDMQLSEQAESDSKAFIDEYLQHHLYLNESQRADIEDELRDTKVLVSDDKDRGKNLILIIVLKMLLNKQTLHINECTDINKSIEEEPRIALNKEEINALIKDAFILIIGNGFAQKVEGK